MFVATVINFLLSSLNTGNQVAAFIVFIRKALNITLKTDYPLPEKPDLVNDVLRSVNVVTFWAANLPVSVKLSQPDPVSNRVRWRYCSAI